MRCSTFPTTRDAHGEAIRVPLLGRCDPQPWRQSPQAVIHAGSSALELISDDALDHPALAGLRDAAADAEIQLPVGRYVEVDGRKDHVRLVMHRLEIGDRPG